MIGRRRRRRSRCGCGGRRARSGGSRARVEKRSPPVVSPLTLTRPRCGSRTVTLASCVTPVRCTTSRPPARTCTGLRIAPVGGTIRTVTRVPVRQPAMHVDHEVVAAAALGQRGGAEPEAGAEDQQEWPRRAARARPYSGLGRRSSSLAARGVGLVRCLRRAAGARGRGRLGHAERADVPDAARADAGELRRPAAGCTSSCSTTSTTSSCTATSGLDAARRSCRCGRCWPTRCRPTCRCWSARWWSGRARDRGRDRLRAAAGVVRRRGARGRWRRSSCARRSTSSASWSSCSSRRPSARRSRLPGHRRTPTAGLTDDPVAWLHALLVPWLVAGLPLAAMCLRMVRATLPEVLLRGLRRARRPRRG